MRLDQTVKNFLFNTNGLKKANFRQPPGTKTDLTALLQREQARSDRTGQIFSTLVFECQNLDQASIQRLWKVATGRKRCTDEAGWSDGEGIGIVLPNTPPEGAWKLADDISKLMNIPSLSLKCKVYVYPSVSLAHVA